MTDEERIAPRDQRGRTAIRPLALRRLIEAITAGVTGVPAARVTAILDDDRGQLAVRVTTPINRATVTDRAENLVDCSRSIVATVQARVLDSVERNLARVDVRITDGDVTAKQRAQ